MTDLPLLDIQRLDTEHEQLVHRRAALPARQTLIDTHAEQATVQGQIEATKVARVETATNQKRLEDEAQIFATKADDDEKRLYGGEVGVKELEPLQEEIKGLRARQSGLEDHALEAMEKGDELLGELAELETRSTDLDALAASTAADIVATEAEIDAELERVVAARAAAVALVDPIHLAEYDKLRPGLGSATVVRFEGGNCVGCPSTMPAMELDRVKHADAGSILTCTECSRIVLR